MSRGKEQPCRWGCGRITRRPVGICIECLPKTHTVAEFADDDALPPGRWEADPRRPHVRRWVPLEDEVVAYAKRIGALIACPYCYATVGERCVSVSGRPISDHSERVVPRRAA
jgi:hypothetical protein